MDDSRKLWLGIGFSILIMVADIVLLVATPMPMYVFWILLVASIVVMIVPVLSFKGPQASITDGRLRVKAPFVDVDIPLSSIQAVECRTNFDIGLRMFGYGGLKSGSGDFTNKEFGSYTLAGTMKIPAFILVHHSGNKILAFNLKDEETTRDLFRSLASQTDGCGTVVSSTDSEKAARTHKSLRRVMIGVVIICIAVVAILVAVVMYSGYVEVSMNDDGITIDASMMHENIEFSDIESVELRDDVDYGTRIGGYGGTDISSGNFRNDEFGKYKLAIHNSVDLCIVIHKASGKVVVFNLPDRESTETFYNDILERLDGQPDSVSMASKPYGADDAGTNPASRWMLA